MPNGEPVKRQNTYALSEEDRIYLIGGANQLREHCLLCKTIPLDARNPEFIDTAGTPYRINAVDILRHEVTDVRSSIRTSCEVHGLKEGSDLLEEHLNQCVVYGCSKGNQLAEKFKTYVLSIEKPKRENTPHEIG